VKGDVLYNDFMSGSMEVVYDSVYPALMSYAIRLLGYDYSFLAEDCVQDSIYKTYLNRKQIATSSQLKSYLYTSCKNKVISILRKASSKKNFLKAVEISEHDSLTFLIEQETLRRLFSAIDNLPESYREIVEMSFEEGLKNTEIAQRLGISESAVKKRKAKMIEKLRAFMHDRHRYEMVIAFIYLSVWWFKHWFK